MTEHTKTDGLPQTLPGPALDAAPQVLDKSRPRSERMASDKIECNACPVLCQISPGRAGACDRYANADGVLVRVDPVVLLRRTLAKGDAALVPFVVRSTASEAALRGAGGDMDAAANPLAAHDDIFVTGIGASTTYPDYKPAPFIVASQADGTGCQVLSNRATTAVSATTCAPASTTSRPMTGTASSISPIVIWSGERPTPRRRAPCSG